MKNQNRIRRNGVIKPAQSQAKIPSEKIVNQQSIPELLIPSKIVIHSKDALRILESVGSAAGALVMLNADVIKESIKVYDGWQLFEVPRFGEGSEELARMMVGEFHSVIKELGDYLRLMMQQIEGCNEPIKAVSRIVYSGLLNGRDGQKANREIENAVRSLCHFIEIQSSALSLRNNGGAYDIGFLMKERLDAAFKALWEAIKKLEGAYLAATVAYDQQAVRRMAA
jgi:hypothetical protein